VEISLKRSDLKSDRVAFFIAPGILEIPTNRGGGIEQNIQYLTSNMTSKHIIYSPFPRASIYYGHSQNSINYSKIPASRTYPLPPHFHMFLLLNYLSIFLFYLGATFWILRNRRILGTVVVFDKIFGIIPLIISRILGIQSVYMEYNIWPWTYSGSYRPSIYKIQIMLGKIAMRLSSIVTANSPSIISGMKRINKRRIVIHLIPTGIDMNSVSGIKWTPPENKFVLLYVGRLVEERGADNLVGLLDLFSSIPDHINLKVIGGGPLFSVLQNSIQNNGLSDRVKMLGPLPHEEVLKHIGTVHSTLFLSNHENYGSLALLECLAIGCPVIATNVGSTHDLIQDYENGVCIQPNPLAILPAIEVLYSDESILKKLSENAITTAEAFNWKKIARTFEDLILSTE
jgi:glycosyltransferase involved in cell wall biosynthesis